MGYRSDVAYSIRFHYHNDGYWREAHQGHPASPRTREEAESLFKLFLAEAKSKDTTRGCFDECWQEGNLGHRAEGFMVDMDKLRINFYVTSVKWYPDYTDVMCHTNLLALAKEYIEDDATHYKRTLPDGTQIQHEVMGYAYVCIGENNDDIQEDYCGDYDYEWVYCSRQLITDFN